MLNGQLESLALAGADAVGLHCAGRVECGLSRRDDNLLKMLRASGELATDVADASQSKSITWVAPLLSAEVRALAWQPGRSLRHAVLRGIAVAG